jgi:hypothetical protein
MLWHRAHLAIICAASLLFPAASGAGELPGQNPAIVDGARCGAEIGAGGNLRTPSAVLAGKCEGSGKSPTLIADNVIEFAAGPDGGGAKDRSELALTEHQHRFKFGIQYRISFDINVPADVDVTHDFFYLAQFWQGPSRPPIAGLRMQRGEARRASVVVRGDGTLAKGKAVLTMDLPPGQWISVAFRLLVKPGDRGCIAASAGDDASSSWCGPIGFTPASGVKPWFRLKFGIYKGHEPGKRFVVRFRDVTVLAVDGEF